MDKQVRASELAQDDWGSYKMAKTDNFSNVSKTMLKGPSLLRSSGQKQHQEHMLSFSSPKSDPFSLTKDYYHHALSSYVRNTGLGSGSLNADMHGALSGTRGPFTPSQWMELEHQALIYKYINANVPVPSNLLNPIRKSLNLSTYAGFPGSFRPNTFGWGALHLGFSGNNDPEPGRCRRTDGKKWRCSRDAVADQKYCERHINRGRHRSRKPVEGQTGHAATKPIPLVSSSQASAGSDGGGASNVLNVAQHQVQSLQSDSAIPSSKSHLNRILSNNKSAVGRLHDSQGLLVGSPAINMKSKDTHFSILKQNIPSRTEFGLITSDSLLNSSERRSYVDCRSYATSPDLNNEESRTQDPLRHFMDDWPKNRSDSFSVAWSGVEQTQVDRTQLSISIPLISDFSSSSSSPTHANRSLSPLRLSREFDPTQTTGLGLRSFPNETTQGQVSWIPISWESSMGGPLGEALNNTSGDQQTNSSSALTLMTQGWDSGIQMELSPTGVLQKTSFGSLSNSSTGSSPRAETNQTREGGSLCEDFLGSTFVNLSSFTPL